MKPSVTPALLIVLTVLLVAVAHLLVRAAVGTPETGPRRDSRSQEWLEERRGTTNPER